MGKGQQQHTSLGCRGDGRGSKGAQQILRNRSLKCMEWQAEVQHEQQQVRWMTANQQGQQQHGTANAGATADARLHMKVRGSCRWRTPQHSQSLCPSHSPHSPPRANSSRVYPYRSHPACSGSCRPTACQAYSLQAILCHQLQLGSHGTPTCQVHHNLQGVCTARIVGSIVVLG